MRAISYCSNHPSREALSRCSACDAWVCELCAIGRRDRTFCSHRCVWQHHLRSAVKTGRGILARQVAPAWSIGLTTVVSLMAAAAIGLLLAELFELSEPSSWPVVRVAVPVAPAAPAAQVRADDGSWRLVLDGAPGSSVVITVGNEPATVVRLGDDGRGELEFSGYPSGNAEVRLASLSGPMTLVSALPTATPTATETPVDTPVATSTTTPSNTTTRTATATATAARTRTATRSPRPPLPSSPTASGLKRRSVPASPHPATATPAPAATRAAPAATATVPAPAAPTSDEATELRPPPVLHLVPDAGPRLALSFDGASSANGTTELLDLLRSLDVAVTIFVTGEFVDANPGIVRRAALAGHEFGNHTYSHPHLTSYAANRRHELLPGVTRALLQDELRRTEEAFRRATGRSMAPLWRAPFGEENRRLRSWAMEIGYLHVRWSSLEGKSLDSLDWVEDEHSPLYVDSRRLVQRLLAFPQLAGGIVLMHLSTNRPEPPWNELPHFTAEVRRRGIAIGSVTELLEASPTWRPWYEQARGRHEEVFEGSREP